MKTPDQWLEIIRQRGATTQPAGTLRLIRQIQADAMRHFGEWHQNQTSKHEHGCVTGDCPHDHQIECWHQLVEDFLDETNRSAAQPNVALCQPAERDVERKTNSGI